MKKKTLLRIGAFFILFTCLGHTVGTFMPIPAEQVEVISATELMKKTMIPMPIGKSQSYSDIFFGNNICMSMFLFSLAMSFILLSTKGELEPFQKKQLLLNNISLIFIAGVSALFFFPMPAIFTGLAASLGFYVFMKS